MNTPKKYLNSPATNAGYPMTVLFHFPAQDASASCEIDGSVLDAIKAGAEREEMSIGEFISQAVALKNQSGKIGKNFVAVNMYPDEQKRLRKLAKECGWPLKSVLWNLSRQARTELEDRVKVLRKTGLHLHELGLDGGEYLKKN